MSFPTEKAYSSTGNETISVEDDQIYRTQLKMQFRGIRKGDLETINSYVKRLQSLALSLAEIDDPVSDSDMVFQLLAGLPDEYDPLQKTISSKLPFPTFVEACYMVFMQESILLKDQGEQNTTDPPVDDGEQFSTSEKFFSVMGKVSSVVGTVSTVYYAVSAVVPALGTMSAVVGIGSVAGWKIWKAFPR